MALFKSRRKGKVFRPTILLQPLEERIVLDAAVASAIVDDHSANQADAGAGSAATGTTATDQATGSAGGQAGSGAAAAPSIPISYEQVFDGDLNVVLISNQLADVETISDAAGPDAKVIVFDAERDSLSTITAQLQDLVNSTGQKIGNLAVVAHSSEGVLTLGTDEIQFFNLETYMPSFEALGETMTPDGQIQLYGCYVAGDVFGQALVDRIAIYTGADVFASVDATGGTWHDWTLEYASAYSPEMNGLLNVDALASIEAELAMTPLKEIQTGTAGGWYSGSIDGGNQLFTNVNGTLFFKAGNYPSTTGTDIELWVSDGTSGGTVEIDINTTTATASSNPLDLIAFQGKLFFTADDGSHGRELWVSDGQAGAGHTYMVKDIRPGTSTSNAFGTGSNNFTVFNGKLYFTATDGTNGTELWSTDGTEGGTQMVANLTAGSGNSSIDNLTPVGDTLFFGGISTTKYLWKTDGTAGGTVQVSTVPYGITSMVDFNGSLFFAANGPGAGYVPSAGLEVWKSDGTAAGTTFFADIYGGGFSSSPSNFTVVNDSLFFLATNGTKVQVWETDGVSAPVGINSSSTMLSPGDLTASGGKLYWSERVVSSNIYHMFMYDPAVGGAAVNVTSGLAATSTGIYSIADANGRVFFTFNATATGFELYEYDGSTITAHEVVDGTTSVSPSDPKYVNGSVFFTANVTGQGRELYKYQLYPWETPAQAPVNQLAAVGPFTEDTVAAVNLGAGIRVSDTDPLTVKLVASAGFSDLSVDGTNFFKVLNLSGTTAALNTQLASLTGHLKPDFFGTASIDITTTDPNGLSDNDILTATVTGVSDPPSVTMPTGERVFSEDAFLTSSLNIANSTSVFTVADPDDGETLTLTVSVIPGKGYSGVNILTTSGPFSTSDSITGTADYINAQINNKIYVRQEPNFNGRAEILLTIDDGVNPPVSVTYNKVSFTAVNDNPVNENVPISVLTSTEDDAVVFSTANGNAITISDVDLPFGTPSQPYTVTFTTAKTGVGDNSSVPLYPGQVANTGNVYVTPTAGVTITGNDSASVTLSGTLDAINQALGDGLEFRPYAEGYAYSGTSNALLTMVTNDNGNIGVGARTDTDVVNFTVTPVADDPVNTLGTFYVPAGTTKVDLTPNGVQVHDGDVNDPLFVEVIAGTGLEGISWGSRPTNYPALLYVGTETFLNSILSGLTATIQPGFSGEATVLVTTTDMSGGSDTDTLSIFVDAPQGAPQLTIGDVGYQVWEDDAPPINLGNCVTVTDPNGDPLSIDLVAPVGSGWASLNASGPATVAPIANGINISGSMADVQASLLSLTGTLEANFNGTATFNVTASDGINPAVNAAVNVPVTLVNDAPVADAVATSGNEDNSIAVTFGLTDPTDAAFAGGANLLDSVTIVTGPSHGTLTPTANPGQWTYTPDLDWFGTDTFTYYVTDDGGTAGGGVNTSAVLTGSITVNPVNDAPQAIAGITGSGNEDSSIILGLGMAGDPNDTPANNLQSINVATGPAHGQVANVGGNWVYTPDANWFGADTFTYTVTDDGGTLNGGVDTSAPELVTVNVFSVNDAPVATPVTTNVTQDTPTIITLALTDPEDAAGPGGANALAGVVATPAAHGSLVPTANPAIWTYTPDAGYLGPDSFTYFVQDNGGTTNGGADTSVAPATVTINVVTPSNTVPTATNMTQNPVILEDSGSLNLTDIVVTDPDGGETITATLTLNETAAGSLSSSTGLYDPATGIWTVSGSVSAVNTALANVTFTPTANWNGTATITTHVEDAAATGPADGLVTVQVTSVNDAPVANAGIVVSGNENTAIPVTLGMTDPTDAAGPSGANSLLQANIVTGPAHGTVTQVGPGPGDWSYTPDLNWAGTDTFTYTVTDSGGTSNGGVDTSAPPTLVTINVTSGNDAPVNTVPLTVQEVSQGSTLSFVGANGVSVSDADAGTAAIQMDLTATHGTVTIGGRPPAGLTITGNGTAAVHLTGTQADINTALTAMTFFADGWYYGPATITVATNDLGHTPPPATTDTDVININVIRLR